MTEHKTIWAALAAAQANFQPVKTSGYNGHLKNNYAKLGDIHNATRHALLDAGLVVSSAPVETENGWVAECTIMHATSGESVTERCPLLIGKNDMQGFGSALSYARRYLLLSMLDLDMDGLDDDGEIAAQRAQKASDATKAPAKGQSTNGGGKTQQEPATNEEHAVISEWKGVQDAYTWAINKGVCDNEYNCKAAMKNILDAHFGGKLTTPNMRHAFLAFYRERLARLAEKQAEGTERVPAVENVEETPF